MTRCPFAVWRPISVNYGHGGRQRLRGFVPHVPVSYGSLWGFFNTPKPPGEEASSDFWCSKTGVLEQYVDLADQAWAQGSHQHNGNADFFSCEFEGYPGEPMTPEQLDTGGRLMAWSITDVNAWPLQVNHDPDSGEGVTPHYVFGGGHTCPGPGPREGQFPDLIAAAERWLGGTQEADMTPGQCRDIKGRKWHFYVDDNGHCHSFLVGKDNGTLLDNDPGWTSGFNAECDPDGTIAVCGRNADGELAQIVFVPGGPHKPLYNVVGGHIYPAA